MEIGIITTYDELNFGAFLQAYSLQKFIEKMGHNALLINFKSPGYRKAEYIATFGPERRAFLKKKNRQMLLKLLAFRVARTKMSVTSEFQDYLQINESGLDAIILGSDEIWNTESCIGLIDPYYFGEGIVLPKIAYAASFGSLSDIKKIPESLRSALKELRHTGVRDRNSVNIAEAIGCRNIAVVPDPTLLVEQPIKHPRRRGYIAYYCVGASTELDREVSVFAQKIGLPVVALGYRHPKFKSVVGISPFRWLGYMHNADFIVTNMFHGTIFAAKYKKNFVVEISDYRRNKLSSLIEQLSLDSRLYSQDKLSHSLIQQPDFSVSLQRMDNCRNQARVYLELGLSSCQV